MAKELVGINLPMVGQSPHHLKNTQHFVPHIQKARMEPGEIMASYNVKVLFTSAPVDPSIQLFQQKLQQDPTLPNRTNMSIPQIITLLEFCLKNTYFLFQGKYYEQVHGAAIGSPISSLIANLFMEEFEVKALSTAPHPHLWLRFVDGIYVIQKAEHSQLLLQHINTQDPHIEFTKEEPNQDGSLPFLDTQVSLGPNNTLITTVYRKPHTYRPYLHWDSNYFIGAKHSVYLTLAHRMKVASHNQQSSLKELDHIRGALQTCHFPPWTLKGLQQKFEHHQTNTDPSSRDNQPNNNSNRNISLVVPYIHGLGGKFKRACKQKGIQDHFKGTHTIKTLLMAPKDKGHKLQKSGIIYKFKCPHINCPEQYIGESGRTLGDRCKGAPLGPIPHSTT